MITIKNSAQIQKMREAGAMLHEVLTQLKGKIEPGISTYELDRFAEKLIRSFGAIPSFLNYNGFPATLCTSVNEQVVHGIPSDKVVLKDGDIVSIDTVVELDGMHADSAYTFAVGTNQSTADAYKSSDFLWGKVSEALPKAEPVGITLDHKMSRLSVTVVAGNGYSADDLNVAAVTICSVKTEAKINLATGAVTAQGDAREVIPNYSEGEYSAYLVPQALNDADLVKIVVGGRTYMLKQSITLEGGKLHKCTVTVTKTDQGINISVSDWIVDSVDYGEVLE